MEPLLRSLVLVFLLAGGVLHVFQRLRLPSIVGLLVAGVLIGPHGLGVLKDRENIETLAEIGILLLMFSIGLDFTRDRFRELIRAASMGTVQMLICIVATMFLAAYFVDRWVEAIFLGFIMCHTSSTLMLKTFLDRGESTTPPVRLSLGISITQDLSSVLMLMAAPIMAGGVFDWGDLGMTLVRAAGVFAVAFTLARWIIPFWLEHVIRSGSRELFLIFLIVVCLGTAWTTLLAGLSIALGAFLAGLAIAESGYSHHTLSEVAPIRDLLVSVFFISIGMLLNVADLTKGVWLSVLLLAAVIVIKFASGFIPTLLWGYPLRIATIVGAATAQLGEFAFVVGHAGYQVGLVRDDLYAKFLLVGVVSMIVNPFLIGGSSRFAQLLNHVPGLRGFDQRGKGEAEEGPGLEGHVIIAGYGLNGRNLATALQTFELPYAVLELNPDTVLAARRRGEPVFFGDCSRVEILRKMGIDVARGLILAISDPQATRQAVQVARNENPYLHIIVRTRYMSEIDQLRELGANEIIAEEFETSLEVLTLTLRLFEIAETAVDRIIEDLRSNAYQALRGQLPSAQRERLLKTLVPQFDFETHQLAENDPAVGKTLRDLDLRAKTGATLLAVRRTDTLTAVPPPDFQFQKDDVLVLAGNGPQIAAAVRLVSGNHEEIGRSAPASEPET